MKNKYLLVLILVIGIGASMAFPQGYMTLSTGNCDGIDTAMVYKESTVITTSIPVGRGEVDERIIAVNVETVDSDNPVELTAIEFALTGTTSLSDLNGLKVYYTAGNPRLTTDHLFGTAAPQEGTIMVIGNQLLKEGFNHFWVTADLSPDAVEGNFLKGEIMSVTVGGQVYPVTPRVTSDARLIVLEHKLLFSGGDYGSVNFRIPAVITAGDGSIVVAVDARRDVPGDLPNNIDIMVRRSTDMGDSWSEAATIADFGAFGASDPSLVKDRNTGNLLCMFASHQGLFQSTPLHPIRFQVCRSGDNGMTWSAPTEHTSQIYAPGWYAAWLASGSVHQMRNGTIVGAIGVRQDSGNVISNFMICSDDGGQSWNYKPAMASAVGDEAKIVELDNGNLMMNIRNRTPDCRKIVISEDGGDSWGEPYYQVELIDPAVNGDFIRYTSVLDGYDRSRLLFSIAAHPTTRKNLTLFLSYDEGATWPVSKVINPGLSGYSCLTVLSDGTIGCFYENGEYEEFQLYFTRVSLDWLKKPGL
ncbi:MAG: exo-alpha-sialidase [Bacteroidales bacterium]|nr:exo-alpha-sialidase [Lentimicrobiaceae bacterium]MDD5695612.1 exo-alpha-sialidase [Bacteroidales bacterium]